jgi:hypothetical protein
MTRTVVTVLVGLQRLMPPGMCLCRLAPAAPPTRVGAATASHVGRSCCSSCGSRPHEEQHECPVPTPAERDDSTPLPASPRDHLPGCPAVAPDVAAKLVVPAGAPFDAALAAHAPATSAGLWVGEFPAACPVPSALTRSGPPLYVTFRVLRN